jgi:DNA polymerase I-like protein with 3'-5' exonuclease and polymerase domains
MDLITLDFETYYSREYSLSKLTTEEYVRDPRFQVIGVGAKVNDNPATWFSGTARQTIEFLQQFDWKNSGCLAHNMMFDGAILSWRCGIRPKALFDTLCMSRALYGTEVPHSLAALSKRMGVGEKGDEVTRAMGKRRTDFTAQEMADYAAYCRNDVDLTYEIFRLMQAKGFPSKELRLIDLTLRMFTEPTLELDHEALVFHLVRTQMAKEDLLRSAGADKSTLMSNPKFAELLRELGVAPPMKISPTTGKQTYAFAKSDEAFKALSEHEDGRVQTLVAARLGNKSTLEETRTQRFIDISQRGLLPVPVRYYAAHTGRWGGDDKINLQNLPSRGANAKKLKKAILAPAGHVLIDCDSSQIEARVLAWLAGQEDLVEAFAQRRDVYKKMASAIYGVPIEEVTDPQRFVGKTTILGAGYGMGGPKFGISLKQSNVLVDEDEARRIIQVYREEHPYIVRLWRAAQYCIEEMVQGGYAPFGRQGVLDVDVAERAIRLPSGLLIRYHDLRGEENDKGVEYTYHTRKGRNRIYGPKVVENVVQGLARCVVGEQMIRIAKRYRVVLTVHDSAVSCVREEEADEAQAYVEECMRTPPGWAHGLPVNCESGVARSYGDC